jgi:tyrosyl-tRNA synthetase
MFGKVMSISDDLMLRYYELLSRKSMEELTALRQGLTDGTIHPKKAKEDLASEIVERYWGKDAALQAKKGFEHIFKDKELPEDIPEITLTAVSWLPQVMRDTGLVKGTSEAIRLIQQGGVKIDNETVTDSEIKLRAGEHIIKVGKRRFYKVTIAQ